MNNTSFLLCWQKPDDNTDYMFCLSKEDLLENANRLIDDGCHILIAEEHLIVSDFYDECTK